MAKSVLMNTKLMDPEKYDENHVKECAETLLEADEIRKDKTLMSNIKKYLDKQKVKISSLKDLKDVASNYSDKQKEKMDQAEETAEGE